MAITLKAVARKNPQTKEVKFYAAKTDTEVISREVFFDGVEKRSTLSSADIKGALDALEFEIKQALLNGQNVRLGDLGSFHLTVTSEACDTKDAVTAATVKRVRVHFTPSSKLVRDMQPVAKGGKATLTMHAKED